MDPSTPDRSTTLADSPATTRRGMFVTDSGQNVLVTFLLLLSLFALWGFCNGLIDVMDKHFQEELHLKLEQSAWVQFAHYLGYLLMAFPAGWLATKLGYRGGIIVGLLIVAVGGFWFIPATHIAQFWAFLVGVCIIAAGLTFLETIANPYATVLGPQESSATRINLAQSTNGLALFFGPIVGASFFYAKDSSGASTGSQTLWIPYACIAVFVIVLAVVFAFAPVPDIKARDDYAGDKPDAAVRDGADGGFAGFVRPWLAPWRHPHFSMAVVSQFLYVAAQAGVWSFFINYMTTQTPEVPRAWDDSLKNAPGFLQGLFETHKDGIFGLSDKGASTLASFGFLCFLTGRFTGSMILRKASAHRVLGLYGVLNTLACLLVFMKLGWISVAAVFVSYFLMSIMFPTIFALGIFGLGDEAKRASSFLVMAIFGGAVVPKLMGGVADRYDLSRAFIVPLLCFAVVGGYGYLWPKLSGHAAMVGVNTAKGH